MPDSIFEIIYLAGLVVGTTVRGVYVIGRGRREVTSERRGGLDTTLTVLCGVGLLMLPLVCVFSSWLDFAAYAMPAGLAWVGAPVFAGAIVLLWRAHVDLGAHWSPTPETLADHTLVTTGVYRYVRHPMYAAHYLWGIAQVLLLHNYVAGPAFLACYIPFLLVRIPREEAMMHERFGDAYRDYVTHTGRIFPQLKQSA